MLEVGQINYNYDTVKVYEVAYPGRVRSDGFIALPFIDPVIDKGVIDKRITRRFYMYFDYQQVDTIHFTFEMKYGQCLRLVMKYFKVTYNDNVYLMGHLNSCGSKFFENETILATIAEQGFIVNPIINNNF